MAVLRGSVDIRGTNNDVMFGACNHCEIVAEIEGATVYRRCDYCRESCLPLEWCMETFSYAPSSLMFPDCYSADQQGVFLFLNQTDEMLFRVHFAPDLDRSLWRDLHAAGIFGPGEPEHHAQAA